MGATVLITRPIVQARAFAAALDAAHGGAVRSVISPLIETVALAVDQDLRDVAHVIFTSVNGVQQANRLGLPHAALAWCVGEKTATAAQNAGFETRVAGGNSETLVALIVAAGLSGRVIHLRGKYAAGDVTGALAQAGLRCDPVLAYDQVAIAPTQAALDTLNGENPVILPLFSPRSAKLFCQIDQFHAPLHLVAISAAVRFSGHFAPVSSIIVAGTDGMVGETVARYRRFSP